MNRHTQDAVPPARLGADFGFSSNDLASQLIRRAARRSPPALAQRLEEEWLADLAARRGRPARLGHALGCWWAARVMAREHAIAARVPVAAAGGSKAFALYVQRDAAFVSRRTPAILAIVLLHAVLVYLFVSGLTPSAVKPATFEPTNASFMEDPRPPVPKTTPIDTRDLTHQQTYNPPIPQPPTSPPPADDRALATPIDPPSPTGTSAPITERIWGGPGPGFPATEDYYPAGAIREGVAGTTTLGVCVGPDGRLNADPTVAATSGSAALDRGAVRLAKAGSGHYRPTTDNGRPVAACYQFRVRFQYRGR